MIQEPLLTARRAALTIMRDRWLRNFVISNYTPIGWWESDVFEITRRGYFREYEVKLSKSDFYRDRDKQAWDGGTNETPGSYLRKHDFLAAHSSRGPSRFWYVAPLDLIQLHELPEWAGLIELCDRGLERPARHRWKCVERKAAPLLHREKCPHPITAHALKSCHWRMHELLKAIDSRNTEEPNHDQDKKAVGQHRSTDRTR